MHWTYLKKFNILNKHTYDTLKLQNCSSNAYIISILVYFNSLVGTQPTYNILIMTLKTTQNEESRQWIALKLDASTLWPPWVFNLLLLKHIRNISYEFTMKQCYLYMIKER